MFGMINTTIRTSREFRHISNALKIGLLLLLCSTTIAGFIWLPEPTTGFLHPALARMVVFHVPCSLVGTVASLVATVYAIMYLGTKRREYDIKSRVSYSIALLFWVLTTVTGAIFANAQWGAYWSWDIKQSCILLLLLILTSYFALRAAIDDPRKQATAGSVYAVFAMVAVPFLTLILPNGLGPTNHPKGTLTTREGLSSEYKWVLYLGFFGLTMVYLWMFRLQVALENVKLRMSLTVDGMDRDVPRVNVRERIRSL